MFVCFANLAGKSKSNLVRFQIPLRKKPKSVRLIMYNAIKNCLRTSNEN